jgi:hypothetical protein
MAVQYDIVDVLTRSSGFGDSMAFPAALKIIGQK